MADEPDFRTQLMALVDDALGDNPKTALIAARALPGEIAWLQHKAVAMARVAGYDWGAISRLLQITRQGARKKFTPVRPTASPYTTLMRRYRQPFRDADRFTERFRTGGAIRPPEPDDPVFW